MAADPTVRRSKPFLAGVQEFAALYGVKPDMPAKWVHRGLLDYSHAVIVSGSAYWPLGFVCRFGESTPRPKTLLRAVQADLVASQAPGWITSDPAEVPPLVGHNEIMALFTLSNQPILSMAVKTGRMPAPDYTLSGSPIWLLDTVLGASSTLQASARTVEWQVDQNVLAALKERRWEGSVIKPRGRRAPQ